MDLLEQAQRRGMKMARGLEHFSYESTLRAGRRKKLWGDLIVTFQYLTRAFKRKGEEFLYGQISDRARVNDLN